MVHKINLLLAVGRDRASATVLQTFNNCGFTTPIRTDNHSQWGVELNDFI